MTIRWKLLVFAISFMALSSVGLHAQSGITEQNGRSITCASDDGKRHLCSAPTQYGVRMTNQRSGSPCIQGQTWGYNNQGIWVDRGCRADFWLGGGYHGGGGNGGYPGGGGNWNGGGQSITCSSDNGKRNYCNVNTRGGVRMVNQRSGSPCIQGQTWGYNQSSIWVDRGCRADFMVGSSGGGGNWNGGGGVQTITCSSDNGTRNNCNADTRGGVRMVNQRSGSPCIQGQTWGYNQSSIWVDRGCRADFVVGSGGGGGGDWNGGGVQTISCSSDNGKRNYCNADTRGGVRMVNQRSGSPCIEGETWGYTNKSIWVDRGCRANFAVGGR